MGTFVHTLRLVSLVAMGVLLGPAPVGLGKEPANYKHAVVIRFDGEIGPPLEAYLSRKLDIAKEQGADLVIIEIESPGGQLLASRDIAERLQTLGWAHTAAFVPRDAISGAAIVALGCDEILIAPQGRIGDAGPIIMSEYGIFEHAPEKIVSYVTALLRSLAEAKGRPPALAEAMADKSLKVFRARNLKTGKETYISERELKANPDEWKSGEAVSESGDGRFLALTGDKAFEYGLANALVRDRQELAERFRLSERDLTILEPTAVDIAVEYLNWWLITGVLLIVGLTGLYVEAMAPGHGVGAAIAVTCFLLLFWSHFLGGTAGWLAVLLFVGGLGCISVELFILPGTILPGLAGAALILVSLVMACQGFLIPETTSQLQTLAGTLGMVVSSCGIFVAAAVVLTRRMDSLPLLNRLTLAPPEEPSPADRLPTGQGERRPEIGDLGVAHTPLRPGGKGRFGEQTIDVLANGDFLDRGTPIRVVRVSGNQLLVEAVEEG
jgi:membrane-bound serine protease (ClpP class)